ncbi:hypothetical protein C2857_003733 [Epichloe festucae Fl1]|uniref:Uncharacterized protein n=1 Tax=Epichloe festucae (strain Fl1) TaxID=877507 RepID=A0A7U3Q216_EPIFF|nr:hypothetical protein C2857_003733 [Epichloe festucae Fl1]
MSPDTVSSLFPDRPIRPLPKRRLRERLSPEVADSISYPPSAQSSLPLFHYPPYILKGGSSPFTIDVSIPIRSTSVEASGRSNALQRNGTVSDDEKEKYRQHRSMLVTRSRPEISSRGSRESAQQELSRQIESQVAQQRHSASSSVDGYDSFENTNNKKKRKIPSAGDLSVNGVHGLSSDINALALSTGPPTPSSEGHHGIDRAYHGSTSHTPSTGYVDNNQATECGGIISSAIANAGKLPPQGQESVSLLEQHSLHPKNTPASAQFTFTCDSQVPGTVQWPAGGSSRQDVPSQTLEMPPNVNAINNSNAGAVNASNTQSRRRARRRLEKELASAARQRKLIAAENFHRNPPKIEDMWICEFCEYERIFGKPPRVLTRVYEIKDRRQRQEEAERKRLLEKAKAKSRKSKKSGKASNKGGSSGQSRDEHHPTDLTDDHETLPIHHDHSHSTQSEEEYDDDLEPHYHNPLPDRNDPPSEGAGNVERNRAKT